MVMKAEAIPFDPRNREEWLKLRAPNVGASEVPSIMGCGFESAVEVYERKLGVAPKEKESEILSRGRCMEAAVFSAIEEFRPEWMLQRPSVYYVDKERRLGCTPDAFASLPNRDGAGTVQCKTVSMPVFREKWLADQSDPRNGLATVPPGYVLQCQSEMLLTGVAWCVMPVLVFDAYSFFLRDFEIEAAPAVQASVLSAVDSFWEDFDAGRRPEIDPSRDFDVIKRIYAIDNGMTIDLTDNEQPWVEMVDELDSLRKGITFATKQKELIEATIRAKMEYAQTALLADGRKLSLKSYTVKGGYREPTTRRSLRIIKGPGDVSSGGEE